MYDSVIQIDLIICYSCGLFFYINVRLKVKLCSPLVAFLGLVLRGRFILY